MKGKVVLLVIFALLICGCATMRKVVSGKMVGCSFYEGIRKLNEELIETLAGEKKESVAVVDFQNVDGSKSLFGTFLAEKIITELFKSRKVNKVVEREYLNRIIEEHKLSLSGLIDEATAQQLGKILGVEAIVTGTITNLRDVVDITARMISAETGEVFAVAAVVIERRQIAALMARSESNSILPKKEKTRETKEDQIAKWGCPKLWPWLAITLHSARERTNSSLESGGEVGVLYYPFFLVGGIERGQKEYIGIGLSWHGFHSHSFDSSYYRDSYGGLASVWLGIEGGALYIFENGKPRLVPCVGVNLGLVARDLPGANFIYPFLFPPFPGRLSIRFWKDGYMVGIGWNFF